MLKILMKKQMQEVGTFLFQDNKKGKRRSKSNFIGYILILVLLYAMLGSMFFTMGAWLGKPLMALQLDWLYFALMGMMSIFLGVFGSVFNTYSSLYLAKDNELLLSMPIKPRDILIARLSGVYVMGVFYEGLVFIPAILAYCMTAGVNIGAIAGGILTMLMISFFVLVLSCLLGWIVALISVHLKNKSYITVVISLVFIGAYYYFYAKAQDYLSMILQNAGVVGETIKNKVFPLYHMGLAATGNIKSLLYFALMVAVLLLITYLILVHSFSKIMTTKKGEKKAVYKKGKVTAGTISSALFGKELKRFTNSATYMLNCGLGTVLILLAAIGVIWKQDTILKMVQAIGLKKETITLFAATALGMLGTMNDITVPSISLEGKNLWILQSLPVSPWQVLKAKLKLHIVLTLVPMLICTICVEYVLRLDVFSMIMLLVLVVLVVCISALSGLVIGLLMPNLNWSNETVAVKQSVGVLIALFGNWIFVMAFCGIYFLAGNIMGAKVYMILCAAVFAVMIWLMVCWLKKKGSRIFAHLVS